MYSRRLNIDSEVVSNRANQQRVPAIKVDRPYLTMMKSINNNTVHHCKETKRHSLTHVE